jgi:hypothetical protein
MGGIDLCTLQHIMGQERPETTTCRRGGKKPMSYKCNTGKGQIETGNNESFEARLKSTIDHPTLEEWSNCLS